MVGNYVALKAIPWRERPWSEGPGCALGQLDTWDFKQAVGVFTTGVTVVTSCDDAGVRYGLTANSFASVSLSRSCSSAPTSARGAWTG